MAKTSEEIKEVDEFGVFDSMPKVNTAVFGNDVNEYWRDEEGHLLIKKRSAVARLMKELFMDKYGKYKEVVQLDALANELGRDIKYYDDNYQIMINIYPSGSNEPYRFSTSYTFHMDLDGKNPILMGLYDFNEGLDALRERVMREETTADVEFINSLTSLN